MQMISIQRVEKCTGTEMGTSPLILNLSPYSQTPDHDVPILLAGNQVDADTHRTVGPTRFPGLERDLRREGSTLLFPAQRLSLDNQGVTWRNPSSVHLHGVS